MTPKHLLSGHNLKYRRKQFRNHVWTYDFVFHRTHDARSLRLLTFLDEYSRACLAIDIGRKLNSEDVLRRLSELFRKGWIPTFIRSDNGSEYTCHCVRTGLKRIQVKTLFIDPGSPCENGYIESFNGKLRDELLNLEIFDTMLQANVLIERWRRHYNEVRPHSSLNYRPPAPEAISPASSLATFAALKPPNCLNKNMDTVT